MSIPFVSSAGLSSAAEPRLLPQKKFGAVLSAAAEWLTLAAIALVPLALLWNTSQTSEFPKQIVLMVLVSLATLCWIGSMLVNKAISLRRSVANPVILSLLAVVLLSALFSGSGYVGLVGGNGQEYQSFITTLLMAAFFFVVANIPDKRRFSGRAIFVATVIGGLVSLCALFQYAGVSLVPGVSGQAFNFIGSTVVLGLYAATTVVMASASFLTELPEGKLALAKRIANAFFGACALVLAMTIDFWPVWAAIIVGLAVILAFAIIRPQAIGRLSWLTVPMVALVISVLLLVVNIPLPIHSPTEVFPSLDQTFRVTRSSLVSHPIFGTGPGTFSQDFTLYRGVELNQSPLWYVQFDRGMSYLMTVAATMGLAGLVAWAAVLAIGIWKSAAYLIASRHKEGEAWVVALAVSAAWLSSAAGLVIYGTSVASLLLFWLLFAALIRATSSETVEIRFASSPRSGLALTFAFVVLIVLSLSGWFVSATRLYSDAAFASAASKDAGKQVDSVISGLESAMRMDPQSDAAARNLSQAYLLKIQQLFADKSIDTDKRNSQIQDLTSKAVKTAMAATAIAPKSAQDWAQLGTVYESINAYVSNAADQAAEAYQKAADLDPSSPSHPTSIGRARLAAASAAAAELASTKDDSIKATAQKKKDEAIQSAIAELENALKLKPDYAPASYQLALAYDLEGKTKEAIGQLTAPYASNPTDLGLGFELASLYYRDGQKDKAQSILEALIKSSPDFANGRWLLAKTYEDAKRYDDALAQMSEVQKANQDNKDVAAFIQQLRDEKDGKAADKP